MGPRGGFEPPSREPQSLMLTELHYLSHTKNIPPNALKVYDITKHMFLESDSLNFSLTLNPVSLIKSISSCSSKK